MQAITTPVADPFGMLTHPESLLEAIEASPRLRGLNGRIYRPLDRPSIPKAPRAEVAAYDEEVDRLVEPPEPDAQSAGVVPDTGMV